jgi:hypothetical protein
MIAEFNRLTPGRFRRATIHASVARTKASITGPVKSCEVGTPGGSGRERGAPIVGAVVVTVTVALVEEFPTVAGFGETEHVASEGAPVQEKITVPDIPPWPVTLRV